MPQLRFYSEEERQEVEDRRLQENLLLTPGQRLEKMFRLMALAIKFKKGPLKLPQGKGIVLKRIKE